jgi:hypothetical protein
MGRSFCRYLPFGEQLSAVHFTAISRSPNRYYLFGGVIQLFLASSLSVHKKRRE